MKPTTVSSEKASLSATKSLASDDARLGANDKADGMDQMARSIRRASLKN